MKNMDKDTLIFKIHFQCKCGNDDTDNFIKSGKHPAELKLLCPFCERKYKIFILTEEIE